VVRPWHGECARLYDDEVARNAFTSESTAQTLQSACRIVGLDCRDAVLLRFGENAIYRLAVTPIVVRIARSAAFLADVQKELNVGRWLAAVGIAAVRPAEVIDQPLVVNGQVVSFWQLIPESSEPASVVDLARLLRQLHSAAVPEGFTLPNLDPFRRIDHRLRHADGVALDDRRFLGEFYDRLKDRYRSVEYVLPTSVLHGDAQVSNLIRHVDGTVLLSDLDPCAIGPPEWDLTLTAVYYDRLRWHSEREYEAFADAYGFNVLTWPGFEVLADIRELRMVTWLMQNTEESPAISAEVRHRVATLRDGVVPRRWRPY
jgi:Ser/Thr protein kinase RdoA (MazF antagonist)